MKAAIVDFGDAAMGAAVELVIGGATHLVQMVLVLVDKMVERLVAFMTEVVPLATLVVVTGQLVTVVYTTSLTTLATVDFAVTDAAMTEDDGVATIVVAGLVDVTMTFDVMGVLRAGQLRTLEAQAVMITSLVLKIVVSGITVVVGFMLEEIMLLVLCEDPALELELELELELTVLLMALMLL